MGNEGETEKTTFTQVAMENFRRVGELASLGIGEELEDLLDVMWWMMPQRFRREYDADYKILDDFEPENEAEKRNIIKEKHILVTKVYDNSGVLFKSIDPNLKTWIYQALDDLRVEFIRDGKPQEILLDDLSSEL